ncbi:MAG TPA: aminotransferase class V-fold PLP-dependent enzyme [Pyrinomonadaceae bacterium]|nr:aminotransferase class V-fold PLP-dependent enzyme [Pyrinomonadaceae bacterium]
MVVDVDWQRARRDFPVTEHLAYLNSAGAGPVPRAASDAATGFYREMLESGDRRWVDWLERRERARASVARLINAEPDEIAFTINTSTGMNLIIDALEGRGEVISCELEFPVSTLPWMHRGIGVRRLPAQDGRLAVEDIRAAMPERGTGVICLSHVQYSNGFRAPLAEIGAAKREHAFVVNAAQSAGVFQIDVKRMKIDALCSTGHKWMLGGFGSGFVFLSRALLEETRARSIGWLSVEHPFAMRNDEFRVRGDAGARAEVGCPHFAGIFSLGAAADYLLQTGTLEIERCALTLNRRLTEQLTTAGWHVLSPLADEAERSAETLVAADDPARVARHLVLRGVAVTQKPEGIRVATHFFNNEEDIARLVAALDEIR